MERVRPQQQPDFFCWGFLCNVTCSSSLSFTVCFNNLHQQAIKVNIYFDHRQPTMKLEQVRMSFFSCQGIGEGLLPGQSFHGLWNIVTCGSAAFHEMEVMFLKNYKTKESLNLNFFILWIILKYNYFRKHCYLGKMTPTYSWNTT